MTAYKNLILFLAVTFLTTGCREISGRKPLIKEFTRQDIKEITTPTNTNFNTNYQNINLQPKIDAPKPTKEMLKLVSINICESMPLKQVIVELARQAKVDLQFDPSIDKRIIFSAQNRPLIDVIKAICDIADLRYEIIRNSIKIEKDSVYPKNYNLQFLNSIRSSKNNISTSTEFLANDLSSQKNFVDNGSNSSLTVTANNDFWQELESNLKIILHSNNNASYSFHKQAGLVSILANSKQHKLVDEYFEKLIDVVSSQVLIEAKIIEVTLKDQFRSGINWQKISKQNDLRFNAPFGDMAKSSRFLDPTSAQSDMISLGASGKTFSAIEQALEEFGTTRTLSSPRLVAMNNQTSILKVTENKIYFRLKYDRQYNNTVNRESVSISSDIQTVPIGMMLLVQPSIDTANKKTTLYLRPTISRYIKSESDPAHDIIYNANINTNNVDSSNLVASKPSLIPVIEFREIDSVLQLQDKEMAILGGLMETRSIQQDNKTPVLGDIPIVKELFSSRAEGDEVIELVILLKATIIPSGASPKPHQTDQKLINNYTRDPRP